MSERADVRPPDSCDVLVIGGGFYGLRIAAMSAAAKRSTLLLEREPRFLARASFNNQARVHGGYHYPRSVLTAMRARQHYTRFTREFGGAVHASFTHLYAIARHQTKVRASEFSEFCRRIGAPLSTAPRALAAHMDPDLVEQVFVAEEAVFDAHRLADQVIADALRAGARCVPGTEVVALEPGHSRRLRVHWRSGDTTGVTEADTVISATYSALNDVLSRSGLASIPLVHELTEIAIVRVPAVLEGLGVTVMDGPFWSCVPFPALGAWSLTHVRYTPHRRWLAGETPPDLHALEQTSHAPLMRRDAERFMPAMRDVRHVASLWEIKTVLPRSAGDDSRPILVRHHEDAPGLVSVLGGKIDSVYDVEDELRSVILTTA